MRRAGFLALLLLATESAGCGERRAIPDPAATGKEPAPSPVTISRLQGAGRAAVKPKPETLAAARSALSESGVGPEEGKCGPYQVLSSAGPEYLATCEALAADLDLLYQARFGVTTPNPPEGLILVFGSAGPYRDYAAEFGRLRAGYAGFTMASRGVVAVLAEDLPLGRFATVLGHELTHLVHRRVFGPDLLPWLSEGLADALGDTATTEGFGDLLGVAGVEPLAERLRQAIDARRVGSVATVMAKTRPEFDRGTVSYDYESSALLVRYLLLERPMAQKFRAVLKRLATGDDCAADCVLEALDVTAEKLDSQFQEWLVAPG